MFLTGNTLFGQIQSKKSKCQFELKLGTKTNLKEFSSKEFNVFFFCKHFWWFQQLSYHQAISYKYFHLQHNAFIIYNESKPVPQRQSYHKGFQKHTVNSQGNISRRSVIPIKLLLCNFNKITPRHGWSLAISRHIPQKTPETENLRGVASDAFTIHPS